MELTDLDLTVSRQQYAILVYWCGYYFMFRRSFGRVNRIDPDQRLLFKFRWSGSNLFCHTFRISKFRDRVLCAQLFDLISNKADPDQRVLFKIHWSRFNLFATFYFYFILISKQAKSGSDDFLVIWLIWFWPVSN